MSSRLNDDYITYPRQKRILRLDDTKPIAGKDGTIRDGRRHVSSGVSSRSLKSKTHKFCTSPLARRGSIFTEIDSKSIHVYWHRRLPVELERFCGSAGDNALRSDKRESGVRQG